MSPWAESLLLWGLLALLLFWFVGAHNRLVRLRSAAMQAFGALDALIVRQIDYVSAMQPDAGGDAAPAGHGGNGSSWANGTPSGWAELAVADPVASQSQASLQAATAQLAAVLAATRPRPLDPSAMAALATALHVMLNAWARQHPGELVAFESDGTLARAVHAPAPSGSAPAPPAAPAPSPAPLSWPEPTALIEMTRAQFNQTVQRYNAAIGQFPAVVLASIFRWRRAAPLV